MKRTPISLVPLLCLLGFAACDGDAPADAGAGPDAAMVDAMTTTCARTADCDDGLYCNGTETCADTRCAPGDSPCTETEVCDETAQRCAAAACGTPEERDADGDGRDSVACGGDDCDDDDGLRYPGNTEYCDPDGHDEDCDPATFGVRDADGDGEPDASCCNGDNCGSDCDDTRAGVSPLATETCGDGIDNDCDGNVDEGVARTCYEDGDRDSYAAIGAATMTDCSCPAGWTDTEPGPGTADCNDDVSSGGAAFHPGAAELCDRLDNDCSVSDTTVEPEPSEDADEDGHAPTDAGCDGGFPKDDCEDDHELVFGGQLRYFDRPWCPRRYAGGSVYCITGRGCVCGTKEQLPSFDYDCSESIEPTPMYVRCTGMSGSGNCLPDGGENQCVGAGPTTPQSAGDCGSTVDWVACSCELAPGTLTGARCEGMALTQRLPCR